VVGRPSTEAPKAKKRHNQVIVLFSAKGGSGATTLAINAARTYVRAKRSVCIVDMNLHVGDVRSALSMRRATTLVQALKWAHEGTPCTPSVLSRHESGIAVISQVGVVDDLDTIVPDQLPELIANLRKSFDNIVLDGIRDFSDIALAVLDTADQVVVIAVPEVLAIRNTKWIVDILRRIGYRSRELAVLLNRHTPMSWEHVDTMRKLLSPTAILTLDSDPKTALLALERGAPLFDLAPDQPLTHKIEEIAWVLAGEEEAREDVSRHRGSAHGPWPTWLGWLPRLFGGE
jgi:pilus assembly protein CpaE